MSTDVFAEGNSALRETLSNEMTLEITGKKTHQTDEVDVEVQIFNLKSQTLYQPADIYAEVHEKNQQQNIWGQTIL